MNTVAPTLYNMDQVAERLGTSKRWLQGFVSGRPFGRMAGRSRVFTESDIAQIIEALPAPPCSSSRVPLKARVGRSGKQASESASMIKLRELLTKKKAPTRSRKAP
jgi:hypothetical protein